LAIYRVAGGLNFTMSLKKNVFLWTYWHPLRKFIQSIPAPVAYSLARIAGVTLYYTAQGKRKTLEDEFRTEEDFCKSLPVRGRDDAIS